MNLTIKFKQFLNKIEAYIKCRNFWAVFAA